MTARRCVHPPAVWSRFRRYKLDIFWDDPHAHMQRYVNRSASIGMAAFLHSVFHMSFLWVSAQTEVLPGCQITYCEFTPYTVILRHLRPSSDPENLSSMGSPSAVPVPWHSTKLTEAAGKDALLRFGWKQTIRNVGKPTFRNKTWLARIKHDDNISNVWKFPVGCSKKGTWLLE